MSYLRTYTSLLKSLQHELISDFGKQFDFVTGVTQSTHTHTTAEEGFDVASYERKKALRLDAVEEIQQLELDIVSQV